MKRPETFFAMADLVVKAHKLSGVIDLPPFKSEAIRALLLAALSGVHPSTVVCLPDEVGDDIAYAISAANTLYYAIAGASEPVFEVGESATLLRLLIPAALSIFGKCIFKLGDSLKRRGLDEYAKSLPCQIRFDGNILAVSGHIPNRCTVSSKRSSQFASGLLLSLPLLAHRKLILPLDRNKGIDMVSLPYFNLTKHVMNDFGIDFIYSIVDQSLIIETRGSYTAPGSIEISGDCSYAANFIVANLLGCEIEFSNLPQQPQAGGITPAMLDLDEIDITDCPDLFPILAIAGCGRRKHMYIRNTDRLRGKESDRIQAMCSGITRLGGNVISGKNCVEIIGNGSLKGGIIDSASDHRIAMAFTIASLITESPVVILNASSITKSAPQFFNDFSKLGGFVCEYIR